MCVLCSHMCWAASGRIISSENLFPLQVPHHHLAAWQAIWISFFFHCVFLPTSPKSMSPQTQAYLVRFHIRPPPSRPKILFSLELRGPHRVALDIIRREQMRVVPNENKRGEKRKGSALAPESACTSYVCATETKTPGSNNWRKISFFLSGFQSIIDKRQEGSEAQSVAVGVCGQGCSHTTHRKQRATGIRWG